MFDLSRFEDVDRQVDFVYHQVIVDKDVDDEGREFFVAVDAFFADGDVEVDAVENAEEVFFDFFFFVGLDAEFDHIDVEAEFELFEDDFFGSPFEEGA